MEAGPEGIRAVLFDLDGTLYRQKPLRARMLRQLALLPLKTLSLRKTRFVLDSIRVFRKVREELRERGRPDESLDALQYSAPAEKLGCEPGELRSVVEEWMHRRPLPYLARCRFPHLEALLRALSATGKRAGVFSDYPPADKLQALGISGFFDLSLCATDPEINAFKPHPRGFLRACELWQLEPAQVLYVGDRPDVDAAGAAAAGMACAILGPAGPGHHGFSDYAELRSALLEG